MMTMIEYSLEPATQAHVHDLAARMRKADVEEAWALAHLEPLQALKAAITGSREPAAGLADGRVFVLFGIAQRSPFSDRGCPWMLATDELDQHSVRFLRESRRLLAEIRLTYPRLENYIDARQVEAVQWLWWLGFTVDLPEFRGLDNLPFHRFHLGMES